MVLCSRNSISKPKTCRITLNFLDLLEKIYTNYHDFTAGRKIKKTSVVLFRHATSCYIMLSMCKAFFTTELFNIGRNPSLYNMCIFKKWFAYDGTFGFTVIRVVRKTFFGDPRAISYI